jgi:hypothetical protein
MEVSKIKTETAENKKRKQNDNKIYESVADMLFGMSKALILSLIV